MAEATDIGIGGDPAKFVLARARLKLPNIAPLGSGCCNCIRVSDGNLNPEPLEGALRATGTVAIIDVFRAFTTAVVTSTTMISPSCSNSSMADRSLV